VYDTTPIDIANFESDADLRRRILFMPFGEAAQRLGALKYEAQSNFVFSQGGQDLEQNDVFKIAYDANGALHVVSATPNNQMEMYLIGENVWVRYGKGTLRQKSRRDTDTDELTAVAWSSLAEVLALFPRATFSDGRRDTQNGRSVTRYHLGLGKGVPMATSAKPVPFLPLPVTPHARWRDQAKPLDLNGTVSIDNDSGVIVKAEIDGHIEVQDRPVRPTELMVHYRANIADVGKVANLKQPKGIAEYRRPTHPRDPLSFFRDHLAPLQGAGKDDDDDNKVQKED
jgi:hypothetical protein